MDFEKIYKERYKKDPDPEVVKMHEEIVAQKLKLAKETADRMKLSGALVPGPSLSDIFREHGYESMVGDGIYYEILNEAREIANVEGGRERKSIPKGTQTPEDVAARPTRRHHQDILDERQTDAMNQWAADQENKKEE